jgi:alkanesulfonate monooxygenase SsuD/methylene tetrahydromethanopterin reductase-like flavin-dependent oxidoreductase (luciferase family)
MKDLRQEPLPLQEKLPIMIGGSGETKTLRTVAKYADMWNAMGKPERLAHKVEVLKEHCAAVGRDVSEIEFTVGCKPIIRDSEEEAQRVWREWMAHNRTPMEEVEDDPTFWPGTPQQIADKLLEVKALGFNTAIAEIPAPFDPETLERFIGEVKPLVDRG